MTKLD